MSVIQGLSRGFIFHVRACVHAYACACV